MRSRAEEADRVVATRGGGAGVGGECRRGGQIRGGDIEQRARGSIENAGVSGEGDEDFEAAERRVRDEGALSGAKDRRSGSVEKQGAEQESPHGGGDEIKGW